MRGFFKKYSGCKPFGVFIRAFLFKNYKAEKDCFLCKNQWNSWFIQSQIQSAGWNISELLKLSAFHFFIHPVETTVYGNFETFYWRPDERMIHWFFISLLFYARNLSSWPVQIFSPPLYSKIKLTMMKKITYYKKAELAVSFCWAWCFCKCLTWRCMRHTWPERI